MNTQWNGGLIIKKSSIIDLLASIRQAKSVFVVRYNFIFEHSKCEWERVNQVQDALKVCVQCEGI